MLVKKAFLAFLILIFLSGKAFTQDSGLSLIRDAQTEKFLRELSYPVFKAANLDPNNIKIYIVNDDSINAFVSGGQNMFINTGLIRKYNTPDALIGVVAHETGHIAAGHLARSGEGQEQAEGAMLLSYLLGAGAIVAGSADAGMALIAGGSNTAQRLYMKYTRNQEEAADGHAIEYLDKISYPADGLIKLLEFFEQEMVGYKGQIDEYLLSHPVSRKRIDVIKAKTAEKNFSDKKINQKLQGEMNVVIAKLEAFIENPEYILAKYHNNNSDLAKYEKSIALFRKGQWQKSLEILDALIAANSVGELPFLYELRGQILFESGKVDEATISYDKTIKMLKTEDSSQARIAFASAILSLKTNDKDLINLAIKRLEEAKPFEEDNGFLFRQLASAYDKIGDNGRSYLALAEYNLVIGNKEKCRKYLKLAKENLPKTAKSELLHLDDISQLVKEDDKKNIQK